MPVRAVVKLLVVAGTVVPATVASGGPVGAQLPTTTTIELPTTTTTDGSATTTTAAPASTTTTTADPGGATTTTTSATSSTTTSSSTSTTVLDGLGGGALAISVPVASVLSPGTPLGSSGIAAQLGPVTVTDGRSGLVAGWTAMVTTSDFTTGQGAPGETIPRTSIAYWSGAAEATTGTADFHPGQPTAADAESLAMPCVAFSALTTSGGTSATWNPSLVVTLPVSAVPGEYHGTITHSVA